MKSSSTIRLENWEKAEKVGADKRYFTCSVRYCQSRKTRMTDSGFFCKEHYLSLPECKIENCNEPVIENGLCREHCMPTYHEGEKEFILYRTEGSYV